MGNSESGLLCKYASLTTEWRILSKSSKTAIYQNTFSNDLCELAKILNIEGQKCEAYHSRKLFSYIYTPQLYDFSTTKRGNCHVPSNQQTFDVEVLVENTPIRLTDFQILNSEQWDFCFKKLEEVLLGFKYLFNKFGAFRISSEQIGWTVSKVTKVWMHKNFWINQKDARGTSEKSMVRDIFDCFSTILNIDFGENTQTFHSALQFYSTLKSSSRDLRKTKKIQLQSERQYKNYQGSGNALRSSRQMVNSIRSSMEKGISIKTIRNKTKNSKFNPSSGQYSIKSPQNLSKAKPNNSHKKINSTTWDLFSNTADKIFTNSRNSYDPSDSFKSNQYYGFTSKGLDQSISKKEHQTTKVHFTYEETGFVRSFGKETKSRTLNFKSETAGSYNTQKALDYVKMDSVSNSQKQTNQFTLKRNKCIDMPYQTSSLKIALSRKTTKVYESCKMNGKFLDFSKAATDRIDYIKYCDNDDTIMAHAEKEIDIICGGESRVLTSEEIEAPQQKNCLRESRQEDIMIISDRFPNQEGAFQKISESQLENEMDDLFKSQRHTEGVDEIEKYDEMRLQVVSILMN